MDNPQVEHGITQNNPAIVEQGANLRPRLHWPMATITSVWVASLIAIFLFIPDYKHYHRRVEQMEVLLRTHCGQWSMLKDASLIPAHQLIVTKCLPRKA